MTMRSQISVVRYLKTFRRDRNGVAAVEFALLLPFLLILAIGMAETVGALNHDRKVAQIASTVTDLVAQSESVSSSDITDIMLAAAEIMEPYKSSGLTVIIASVTFNEDGDPEVDWSRNNGGGTPWAAGSEPPIEIPDSVAVPGSSLVIGKSSYAYVPMFSTLIQDLFPRAAAMTLDAEYYNTPRLSSKVTLSGG